MQLDLEELKIAIKTISAPQCDFLKENCIVAFEEHKHNSGCVLALTGDNVEDINIMWNSVVNKAGYKEPKKYTEHGAEAISFLLTRKYTEYTIVEEAIISTGIDYWIGYDPEDMRYNPKNFMQARLEISGILKESDTNTLKKRIGEKKAQTSPSDGFKLPAYISVVEFSTPKAYFGIK